MNQALSLQQVSLYGKLEDVSFAVRAGERIVIEGSPPIGRLLLRMIGGLEVPDSGKVLLFDKPLSQLREHQIAQLRCTHLAYAGWDSPLLEHCSILENVTLPLAICGKQKSNQKQDGENLLRQLGLIHVIHGYPNELSPLERRSTLLARAVIGAPKLLLLDDLCAGLREQQAEKISAQINELYTDYGFALLAFTSEELPNLERETTLTLKRGKIERRA
jgi:predicted ABC-type transport system involved in lysophospholipase L1 biosynthesis ATPase subunit